MAQKDKGAIAQSDFVAQKVGTNLRTKEIFNIPPSLHTLGLVQGLRTIPFTFYNVH